MSMRKPTFPAPKEVSSCDNAHRPSRLKAVLDMDLQDVSIGWGKVGQVDQVSYSYNGLNYTCIKILRNMLHRDSNFHSFFSETTLEYELFIKKYFKRASSDYRPLIKAQELPDLVTEYLESKSKEVISKKQLRALIVWTVPCNDERKPNYDLV